MENDANAAAYGEFLHYKNPTIGSFVMLTLGTGIGGSVIQNGKILTGVNGSAGELGHITIDVNGTPCNCGSFGCFENYASATA
ncbi:MAG: ROK family protein, partial [Ruthenibacterium sp.]